MTSKLYVKFFMWFTLTILILICGINFWIDGKGNHHLYYETNIFPRSTKDTALSKLYFLSEEKPDTVYFGSSRVEVGLPVNPEIVGGDKVYNAGLPGAVLGQWAPFIKHNIEINEPKRIVIGIDFPSFTTKGGASDLELSLLSSNSAIYFVKRFIYDITESISFDSISSSFKSISYFCKNKPYDEFVINYFGQKTDALMHKMTIERGKTDKAFKKKVLMSFNTPGSDVADQNAWHIFENLIDEGCKKNIVIRIFIHPTHALTLETIRKSQTTWDRFEQWKINLASLSDYYLQRNCNINIIDFSGYNSVTTESIHDLTPTTNLKYYWEASHYKSNVGEMILKRLFVNNASDIPNDFGYELHKETAATVMATIRQEQSRYLATHAEDIKLAQKWLSEQNH